MIIRIRSICERAVLFVQRYGTVQRIRNDFQCQAVAISICVVGQYSIRSRYCQWRVLGGGVAVCNCNRSVIYGVYRNGHRGRGFTAVTVINGVCESIGPAPVRFWRINYFSVHYRDLAYCSRGVI